jgi:hypothetical protein
VLADGVALAGAANAAPGSRSRRWELAMTLKSEVASRVAEVVGQIERRVDGVPAQMRDAQATVAGWGAQARRFARKNPGTVLVGAFAIGFILAKAARHA